MRTIDITGNHGRIMLTENEHDDTTTIDVDPGSHGVVFQPNAIELTADQLWQLGEQIVSWFGAKVLRVDDQHKLRERIEHVLSENESRCMDDDIDRGVVVNALVRALS